MNADARPRRSYPKGEQRKTEIVDRALDVFADRGYQNTSMVEIASACGVSRAGLLHHFPTKESLLSAVLDEKEKRDYAAYFAENDRDPRETLRQFVLLVEHNTTRPGLVRLFAALSVDASDADHPAHAYFTTRYRTLRRRLTGTFEALAKSGTALTDAPEVLAAELIALVDGLQIQWLLDPTSVDIAERLTARLETVVGGIFRR